MKIRGIDCSCVSAKTWTNVGRRKFQVLAYRPKEDIKKENWDGRIFYVANFIEIKTGDISLHYLVKNFREANTIALMNKKEFDDVTLNPKYDLNPKIPTGMTLQKSLTKTGGQMHFKNGGGKKKPKPLTAKKTNKRVRRIKKGSDNLMTFGIRVPDVKTLEDLVK